MLTLNRPQLKSCQASNIAPFTSLMITSDYVTDVIDLCRWYVTNQSNTIHYHHHDVTCLKIPGTSADYKSAINSNTQSWLVRNVPFKTSRYLINVSPWTCLFIAMCPSTPYTIHLLPLPGGAEHQLRTAIMPPPFTFSPYCNLRNTTVSGFLCSDPILNHALPF